MNGKVTFIICFCVSLCALKISADDEFFKVPLEIREKNRPLRLVDNLDDPDMRALKDVQDKFFNIVSNSSVGKEFKSFKQLLHLVDSKAGIELGRLMFQGIMIAYGKDNSNQLLNEFIDDFQYRAPPRLADALVDYKDFLKTVDLKMIPLTLQTIFQKDELGNSLAQLPLGQLVDLVQPEASKYGIDIKGVINGILGKGDSTFPNLVKKLLDNFNASSVLKNLANLQTGKFSGDTESSLSGEMKRQRKDLKDPALMLFKPFISKILKENKIDLEPDAVIQVLTPFVAPILQSFMPSGASKDGKQGGNFDFSQILPMLTLLGSQMGGSKKDESRLESPIEPELAGYSKQESQESKIGRGDSMGNVMNLVSGLLQMSDNLKKGKIDDSEAGKEQDLLQLAMALMGNMGGKGKTDDQMGNLLNLAAGALQMSNKNGKISEDSSAKTMQLLQSAMSLMGNAGDKKSDGNPMAGLLSLASAFMSNKKDGKDGDPMAGLLGLASSFMGNTKDGNGGDPMANLLGLTSSLVEGQKEGKTDVFQMITGILGGPNGKEIRSMVKIAAALFGSGRKKRRDTPRNLAGGLESEQDIIQEREKWMSEFKETVKSDPRYLAAKENVENVLSELQDRQNETVSELSHDADETFIDKDKKETKFSSQEFDRTKSFPYAIEKFVGKMQQEQRDVSRIHLLFTNIKDYFTSKINSRKDIEDYLSIYLKPLDGTINVQALTAPFFLTEQHFEQFLNQISKEAFTEHNFVTTTSGVLIKRFLDKGVSKNIIAAFGEQLSNILLHTGTPDVTFENFPKTLSYLVAILSKKQGLPDHIEQLLYPLQYSMKSMISWYQNAALKHSTTPQDELRQIFVESFYDEVILPLKQLWKIRRVSKASKSCIPREVCDYLNNIDEENVVETLVAQIGSIIYGGFISEAESNPQLFMQIIRAAVYRGNCEEAFPLTCEKKASKTDDNDFKYEHIEL